MQISTRRPSAQPRPAWIPRTSFIKVRLKLMVMLKVAWGKSRYSWKTNHSMLADPTKKSYFELYWQCGNNSCRTQLISGRLVRVAAGEICFRGRTIMMLGSTVNRCNQCNPSGWIWNLRVSDGWPGCVVAENRCMQAFKIPWKTDDEVLRYL